MSDETTEQSVPVQLQLGDLVSALETIQLASSRGAFKPEEFTAIGGVYERIFAFLETTGAVSRPAPVEQQQGNQV
jgi:hypothetical protein